MHRHILVYSEAQNLSVNHFYLKLQLRRKMVTIKAFALEMKTKILEVNPALREEFAESDICPIQEIKPSPVTEKYRNKCEYTIGEC